MSIADKMLYAMAALAAAVALATVGFFVFDWVWAAVTVVMVALWACLLWRKCRKRY